VIILVLPRDGNPYQRLLYAEMSKLGARIIYLGELTPSHTLNILLLPFELAVRRLAGARLVHLHWVFAFGLPGSSRWQTMRRLSQGWFMLWLLMSRLCGMRLTWTAHNVLPHEQVFADDLRARRELVRRCDAVFAHSQFALDQLASVVGKVKRGVVVEHGPMAPVERREPDPDAKQDPGVRKLLFIGQIKPYKGIDELVSAFLALPESEPLHLTVAGKCTDGTIRSRLEAFANKADSRLAVRCEYLPDEEVTRLLDEADVVVLPFRAITTSGSLHLALSHSKPVIVPDVPGVAELPSAAAIRYDGSLGGLAAAMMEAARADRSALAGMSVAASAYAYRISWQDVASKTMTVMTSLLETDAATG
jgi:glycosyltransferase involved in cell wall biosynthesis